LWSYETDVLKLDFSFGLMIDHSKCGINTMFNTGTVGVSANIFGSGFRVILYQFFLGGASGLPTTSLKKAFETARLVESKKR
jgi:hypothetical protein